MQIMQIIVEKLTVSVVFICFSCFLYENEIKWEGCGFRFPQNKYWWAYWLNLYPGRKKLSVKCIKVNGEEIESFAEVSGSQMLLLRKKIPKVQIPKSAINMISSIFSVIKWSDLLSAFILYSSILFQYDKYWLISGETSETQSSLSLKHWMKERFVSGRGYSHVCAGAIDSAVRAEGC